MRDDEAVWVCERCAHTYEHPQAPDRCENCRYPYLTGFPTRLLWARETAEEYSQEVLDRQAAQHS
jgi:hypothetical protein